MSNRIEIFCPKCKKLATTQYTHTTSYYDPRYSCKHKKCGYEGKLYWRNPAYAA